MWTIIFFITTVLGALGCLYYIFAWKKAKEIKEANFQNELRTIESLKNQICSLETKKRELDFEISTIQKNSQDAQSNLKRINDCIHQVDNIYSKREYELQDRYNQKENSLKIEYDNRIQQLNNELNSIQCELDSLKSTRAKIVEAWRREEEEKANQDFYRLVISDSQKEDIKLLLYMLNMTIYCVTLINEKVKDIKEIKEFNI